MRSAFVQASRLYDAESGETTRWDWPTPDESEGRQ